MVRPPTTFLVAAKKKAWIPAVAGMTNCVSARVDHSDTWYNIPKARRNPCPAACPQQESPQRHGAEKPRNQFDILPCLCADSLLQMVIKYPDFAERMIHQRPQVLMYADHPRHRRPEPVLGRSTRRTAITSEEAGLSAAGIISPLRGLRVFVSSWWIWFADGQREVSGDQTRRTCRANRASAAKCYHVICRAGFFFTR